ncbi:MAG: prenyltransferase/squalene oxidase repeat-containing protein [Planctomycetota bacterium]
MSQAVSSADSSSSRQSGLSLSSHRLQTSAEATESSRPLPPPPVEMSTSSSNPPPPDGRKKPPPVESQAVENQPAKADAVNAGGPPLVDSRQQTEAESHASAPSQPALPPPPPPRATLPSVRSIPDVPNSRLDTRPAPATGIGSANLRWRGETPVINTSATPSVAAKHSVMADTPLERPDSIAGTEEEDENEAIENVARSAPSWLLSLVMHLIALLILALLSFPSGNGFTNLVLDFGMSEEPAEEAVELDLSTPEFVETIEAPEDALDDSLMETEIPKIFDTIEPPEEEMEKVTPLLDGANSIEISKPMFSGRTGAMRQALMAMFGATEETKNAVKLGLAWLKRQQHRSGYWSMRGPYSSGAFSENRPAATAMALLAFAGDGNTHQSGLYRMEVEKGLKYLVGQMDRGGFMAGKARGNERAYAQAQATIVLCEIYGMTKDSWLRPYAQRSIDYAMKAQGRNGGWRYQPGEPGDTSVTGWYVMAIQSALSAGLEVDDEKVRKISNYLDDASVYYGAAYAYQPGRADATPAMTAEGLLCRQYLGWPRDRAELLDGMDMLRNDAPFEIKNHNVYYWYYATQVFHHYGGEMWRQWNDDMKVKLPAIQIKSGAERGSWAPQKDRWSIGGRLYTTCLSIYCLEVYYRHMPLYDNK